MSNGDKVLIASCLTTALLLLTLYCILRGAVTMVTAPILAPFELVQPR